MNTVSRGSVLPCKAQNLQVCTAGGGECCTGLTCYTVDAYEARWPCGTTNPPTSATCFCDAPSCAPLGADCSTMEAAAALRPAIVAFQQTMRRMRMAKAGLGQSDQPGVVLQYKAKPKPIARRSSAGHILAAAR